MNVFSEPLVTRIFFQDTQFKDLSLLTVCFRLFFSLFLIAKIILNIRSILTYVWTLISGFRLIITIVEWLTASVFILQITNQQRKCMKEIFIDCCYESL